MSLISFVLYTIYQIVVIFTLFHLGFYLTLKNKNNDFQYTRETFWIFNIVICILIFMINFFPTFIQKS
jgi:hypothetical protein